MGEKLKIVWRNIFIFLLYHYAAVHGIYYICTREVQTKTLLWFVPLLLMSGQGITAGAHRLWAHRTYKAKLPLRVMLCLFQTISFQNDVYEWARDHRVHHKFTDTDADPHNSSRGFFFSHMGWLLCRKHPDVFTKGKTVDMSDLEADPILMFQRKYYLILAPLFSFLIPTIVPWYFWNENFYISWTVAAMLRYILSLHFTWLVNSAAHMWGTKPYDKHIKPVQNPTVSFLTAGEGWHNYHHAFPWDYKADELGNYTLNFTTAFIDFMAKIGWAYDLKAAPTDMIIKRIKRTGILKIDSISNTPTKYYSEKKQLQFIENHKHPAVESLR